MSEINITAILYPAPGKTNRIKELLGPMTQKVHSQEDYTLRYMQTEQIDPPSGSEPDIIMVETYKSKEGAEKHTSTTHFKELFAVFEKEGLFAKKPYLAYTKSVQGFDLDRKLI